MKKMKKKSSTQYSLTSQMMYRLHEGILLIFCATAIFLLVSLLTYTHTDPGWTNVVNKYQIMNWGGRVGAWLADVLFLLLGYVAYLLPLMMLLKSYKAFSARDAQLAALYKRRFLMPDTIVKIISSICWVASCCGLAHLCGRQYGIYLPAYAGGVLGDLVSRGLTHIFNPSGSILFLLATFLSSITLTIGLSWLTLIRNVSILLGRGIYYLRQVISKKCTLYIVQSNNKLAAMRKALSSDEKKLVLSDKKIIMPVIDHGEAIEIKVVTDQSKDKRLVAPPIEKKQEKLASSVVVKAGSLPPLLLLNQPTPVDKKPLSQIRFEEWSRLVEQRLLDFGVEVKVTAACPGPVITRFELELAPGVKVSKITGLSKDIARSLSVASVRVVEVIPGKSVVGLEIANENREVVSLREILESKQYEEMYSPVSLALGKDIAGLPVIVDLAKMPHLLVAGTTGSGKSVSLNAMLLSMLYKATPSALRFILIDPKMLELSIYDGIPHLLTPVITDMKDASNALRWCVFEMDKRYRLMATLGVRNLASYNLKVQEAIKQGNPILAPEWLTTKVGECLPLEPLPLIVVVADELADMMMVVGKKVEELVVRLAQKARAAGIHLILATQRPSVDVITGLIKANVPTRIAFQVSSRIDSRTILDQQGAEQLLGHGDMLYLPAGAGIPIRVHGAYVSDEEVHRVVAAWQTYGKPEYLSGVTDDVNEDTGTEGNSSGEVDPLYDQAVRIVTESRRASISLIQRRLRIGYNRAARLMEEMEAAGLVSAMDSGGSREVLAEPPPMV